MKIDYSPDSWATAWVQVALWGPAPMETRVDALRLEAALRLEEALRPEAALRVESDNLSLSISADSWKR